jgi:hypothetical protein
LKNAIKQSPVYPLFLGVLLALLPGCSSNKCVPVAGAVTMDGGAVPGPGYIYFAAEAASKEGPMRPGTAEFDALGKYRATTFAPGDGLLPGKYLLRVDCWKTPPNMEGKPVVTYLPQRYQDAARSGLALAVEPGSAPITFNIDLQSK